MISLFSSISATFSHHIHSHSVFAYLDKENFYFRYNASLIGIILNKNSCRLALLTVLGFLPHLWK